MKKQYVLLGLIALVTQLAVAQFTLGGEFRPRSEYFGNGGNQQLIGLIGKNGNG